ncbi:hypothetical protein TRAPUB_12985 [Trametes pubescens]|uniref:Uncharacterized protein n=1 Tax=Trametes pubescens TaxID=154538 RepID=A0A1M2VSH6_TRAPU|nr:hypothetical protein TRAPUB_12985 [Trametes pubescens]
MHTDDENGTLNRTPELGTPEDVEEDEALESVAEALIPDAEVLVDSLDEAPEAVSEGLTSASVELDEARRVFAIRKGDPVGPLGVMTWSWAASSFAVSKVP